jgi:DHA2 family multidrug resistance protein-like MFS transporter
VALMGWYYVLPLVLFCQGIINSMRFVDEYPDAERSAGRSGSSGNSLLSMVMQLSMSIGVTIAGLLLGMYGQQHISVDAPAPIRSFSIPISAWRSLSPCPRSSSPACRMIPARTS